MSFIQQLKSCPLFYELHDDEIMNIMEDYFVLDLDPEQFIFRDGDLGEELYLLMSGNAKVFKNGKHVASLKKGDLFGEMVLLKDQIRKADILTDTNCSVLVINYKNFKNVFNQNYKVFSLIMFNLSRMLADRLIKADGIIEEMKKAA